MKKRFLFIIVLVIFVAAFSFVLKRPEKKAPEITSFEECVAAGNPILESYPRQCRDSGQLFTEIVTTFTQTKGPISYSIDLPQGWFAHERDNSVIFTQNPVLDIPKNTEGFAVGPNFYIIVNNITDIEGVSGYNEWLEKNGFTEASDLFVKSNSVNVSGMEMLRIITRAAGAEGEILHYVYFADIQRVITLSQFPYNQESDITRVFESAVQTFHVPEKQGGEGILPYKSGVTGRVFLGPTCPVEKYPQDPACADKPYETVVQVIAIGSPKSSPFALAESDKEGRYKAMLPPGEYGLQAVGKNPFPKCETKTVVVEPDILQEVDLLCDTGIR